MATEGDLERTLLRLGWRLDALDEWRQSIEARVVLNTKELDRLVKADEIADAVAEKLAEQNSLLRRRNAFHMTSLQARAAVAGVLVAAAALIVDTLFSAKVF